MEKNQTTALRSDDQNYDPPRIVAILPLHLVFQGAGSFLFDSVSETACPAGDSVSDDEGICP